MAGLVPKVISVEKGKISRRKEKKQPKSQVLKYIEEYIQILKMTHQTKDIKVDGDDVYIKTDLVAKMMINAKVELGLSIDQGETKREKIFIRVQKQK